jgi:hypothetical protein
MTKCVSINTERSLKFFILDLIMIIDLKNGLDMFSFSLLNLMRSSKEIIDSNKVKIFDFFQFCGIWYFDLSTWKLV